MNIIRKRDLLKESNGKQNNTTLFNNVNKKYCQVQKTRLSTKAK